MYRKLTTVAAVAALAFGLAACGGGGSDEPTASAPPPTTTPDPTPYEMATAGIVAATTAEEAQAAYDAVKDDVTATQGDMLQAAVDARIMALATMARADEQTMALTTAAGMIDTSDLSTQEAVDAARAAIVALRGAIDAAVDVADTSMYESRLAAATMDVDEAQGGIDTATRRTNQMAALSGASDTLQAALAALSGSTPTQAQLDAANAAVTGLNDAITAGADLTDAEKATYVREAANAAAPISTAQMAFNDAEDEAQKAADAAMAVTAAKLHAGISVPTATDADDADTDTTTGTRFAGYVTTADIPTGASVGDIVVGISNNADVALSEDEDTTVPELDGWTGKRYHRTMPAAEGMYEAMVYSHVGEPTPGKKFGGAATNDEFEYALTDGALTATQLTAAASGTTPAAASRIVLTGVTRTAGTESFELPDPNPNGVSIISVSGSFHGVAGTYRCPTTAGTACTAEVAAKGFTLAGGTAGWTFKPDDANARVMETPDTAYASYGWWLHTATNGDLTASAFHAYQGTDADAVSALPPAGTAKYVGGAAGKYALTSTTGGINDAGHFTARATLEAKFGATHTISGAIDQFKGADGMDRDWTVELMESTITASNGTIARTDADDTVWTIGETAADASGEWLGSLRETGDDGVPAIATGTFYTEYGTAGKMVGAFGANKQ